MLRLKIETNLNLYKLLKIFDHYRNRNLYITLLETKLNLILFSAINGPQF